MNWETYLAFGDSITIGARTYLGYPELTGDLLIKKLDKQWNVINHAVSGFKAIDLARYIDLHFDNLKSQKASISTILIGTNDIKENTALSDYEIAMNQILLKTKMITTNGNVVVLFIPEFHKGVMYPYSIDMNTSVKLYNETLEKIAKNTNVRCLRLQHDASDFLDGVHLNRQGITRFSDQVSTFILKDRGIEIG